MNLGNLVYAIKLKNSDFLTKANQVNSKFDALKQKSIAVTAGLAGLVAGITAAGVKIAKLGMDAEETKNKFDAVFKEMALDTEQWARDFGKNYGFARTQMLGFLSSIQDTLVPMGMARDAAANMSQDIVSLAADLGSFNNLPTEQVIRDIQSTLVGNTETMRKYGVVITETRMKQFALTQGIIKEGEKLDELQKMRVRYLLMINDTTDAQGDLARTMNSSANQYRKMKNRIIDIADTLGKVILPTVNDVLKGVNGLLDVIDDLPDPVKESAGKFLLLGAGMIAVVSGGMLLLPMLAKIVKGFGIVKKAIGLLSNPIGWIIAAAFALYSAWKQNLWGFRDLVNNAWLSVKEWFENIFSGGNETANALFSAFSGVFGKILEVAKNWVNLNLDLFLLVKNTITYYFTKIYEAITTAFSEGFKNASNYIQGQGGIFAVIKNFINSAIDMFIKLKNVVFEVFSNISHYVGNVGENLSTIFSFNTSLEEKWEAIKEMGSNITDIGSLFEIDWEKVGEGTGLDHLKIAGEKAIAFLTDGMEEGRQNIISKLKDILPPEITKGLGEDHVKNIGNALFDIKDMVIEKLPELKGKLGDWGDTVVGGIGELMEAMKDTVQETFDDILKIVEENAPDLYQQIKAIVDGFNTNPEDPVSAGGNGGGGGGSTVTPKPEKTTNQIEWEYEHGIMSIDEYLSYLNEKLREAEKVYGFWSDEALAIVSRIEEEEKKAADKKKERDENRVNWEYEQGIKSSADYLQHLQQKLADAEQWSDDYVSILQEIKQVEGEIADDSKSNWQQFLSDLYAEAQDHPIIQLFSNMGFNETKVGQLFQKASVKLGGMIDGFFSKIFGGGWVGILMEIIKQTKSFQVAIKILNAFMAPFISLIDAILLPLLKFIGGLWNAIIDGLSSISILGWKPFGDLKDYKIKFDDEEKDPPPEEDSKKTTVNGSQITNLTGASRNFLTDLLRPWRDLTTININIDYIRRSVADIASMLKTGTLASITPAAAGTGGKVWNVQNLEVHVYPATQEIGNNILNVLGEEFEDAAQRRGQT